MASNCSLRIPFVRKTKYICLARLWLGLWLSHYLSLPAVVVWPALPKLGQPRFRSGGIHLHCKWSSLLGIVLKSASGVFGVDRTISFCNAKKIVSMGMLAAGRWWIHYD